MIILFAIKIILSNLIGILKFKKFSIYKLNSWIGICDNYSVHKSTKYLVIQFIFIYFVDKVVIDDLESQ